MVSAFNSSKETGHSQKPRDFSFSALPFVWFATALEVWWQEGAETNVSFWQSDRREDLQPK